MAFLLAVCAGILLASYSAFLPSERECLLIVLLGCIALLTAHYSARLIPRISWVVLGLCIGAGWSWGYGFYLQRQMLPEVFVGKNLEVVGRIEGLPDVNDQRSRFMLKVEKYRLLASAGGVRSDWIRVSGNPLAKENGLSSKLRLSWYGAPELMPEQSWSLLVRVKPSRGSVNPGGFDYQRWLLSRGVGATGYVRREGDNYQISAQTLSVDALRFSIRGALQDSLALGVERSLLMALALGDRGEISADTWRLLRDTGTVHLLAISGLHIGLVAGFGYFLFSWLGRCLSLGFSYSLFYPYWGAAGALVSALFYALLAGLTLPTLRALIMVAVACLYVSTSRLSSRWNGYLVALLLCLLVDPLAGFDPGFWLSFVAVAGLLLAFSVEEAGGSAIKKTVQPFLRAQWVVFWALLVPLVVVGLPLIVIAPLVNVIAIPLVGLYVVPFLLLGILLWLLGAADLCWGLASEGVSLLLWLLNSLVNESGPHAGQVFSPYFIRGDYSYWAMTIIAVCCVAVLVPKLRYRWMAFGVLAVLFLVGVKHSKPFLRMTILDVGQGLAVVVEVGDKTLLYDTGPRWGGSVAVSSRTASEHALSRRAVKAKASTAAESVVLPYLRYRGIYSLDRVIISHGDNDHQGGATTIAQHMEVGLWFAGERARLPGVVTAETCHGQHWEWQGVVFNILPWVPAKGEVGNNHSCVLVVDTGHRIIMIPGDIEASREWEQIDLVPKPVDVLLAAHHGSGTSSSASFVYAAQPRHVVVSAGYRNHYHHPHPSVIQRFERIGAEVHNTADVGAVTFTVSRQGDIQMQRARETGRRYWYGFADEL